eukprot:9452648-Pyramimonas_sp.AAC.1
MSSYCQALPPWRRLLTSVTMFEHAVCPDEGASITLIVQYSSRRALSTRARMHPGLLEASF